MAIARVKDDAGNGDHDPWRFTMRHSIANIALATGAVFLLLAVPTGAQETTTTKTQTRTTTQNQVRAQQPTLLPEGGVAGGLQELAIASGVGVVAYEERMPMHPAARRVLEAVGADPLTTISSGSLLIAADRGAADGILASLRGRGIEARVVGEVVGDPGRRVVVRRDGSVLDLGGEVRDDLWRVLAPRLGG